MSRPTFVNKMGLATPEQKAARKAAAQRAKARKISQRTLDMIRKAFPAENTQIADAAAVASTLRPDASLAFTGPSGDVRYAVNDAARDLAPTQPIPVPKREELPINGGIEDSITAMLRTGRKGS